MAEKLWRITPVGLAWRVYRTFCLVERDYYLKSKGYRY